jgi:hypothetical protein
MTDHGLASAQLGTVGLAEAPNRPATRVGLWIPRTIAPDADLRVE